MAKRGAVLELLSETRFDDRVPEGFPATCPSAELSATWDLSIKNLLIYRPLSQVVSKIHQSSKRRDDAPEPQAATWKSDGEPESFSRAAAPGRDFAS